MKKLFYCLLAFTMVLPMSTNVHAQESDTKETVAVATGNLMVDMDFNIPLQKTKTGMTLTLQKGSESLRIDLAVTDTAASGTIGSHTVDLQQMVNRGNTDSDVLDNILVMANGLPEGTYTLELSAPGFRTVKREVVIEGYSKYLHINDLSVFIMGDVNHDGIVNDEDYQLVLSAIDTTESTAIETYDLNHDGIVDIQDLSYVHQTLGNLPLDPKESLGNPILKEDTLSLLPADGTKIVSGEVKDLINTESNQPLVVGFTDPDKTLGVDDANIVIPLKVAGDPVSMTKIDIQPGVGEHAITNGEVIVTYMDESGKEQELVLPFDNSTSIAYFQRAARVTDHIMIDLGKQVAVKEITIRVTGTRTNKNLAEISKVEFLNDVYEKIPEPDVAYPKNVKAASENESLTITWDKVVNVSGYEVKYSGLDPKTNKIIEKTVKTDTNSVTLSKLSNYVTYVISVQSITDDGWKSGFGESITGTPLPTSVPKMVTGLNAQGSYRAIQLSWGKAENALTYNVYYRIKENGGNYQKVTGLKSTSYKIADLEDGKEYQIYVTASNEIGEGPKSAIGIASTVSMVPTITSNYHLINFSQGAGNVTAGIKDVTYPSKPNPNDYPFTYDKFDIVDDDYTSYWNFNSWDAGGVNSGKPSPIVEFDEAHTFGEFIVVPSYNFTGGLSYVKIRYWDEAGNAKIVDDAKMKSYKDENNNMYYRILLKEPITSSKVQINVAQYWAGNNNIKISEFKYYTYDSLAEDIDALFADDLQIELRDDVTQATIDALRVRLETEDQGDKHPDYVQLTKDLNYAEDILNDISLSDEIMTVDQLMSTKNDAGKGFSYQLSDLQPLGVAAKAGDQVTLYLGRTAGAQGSVQVVFSQPFATPDRWTVVQTLNAGKNVITVPDITSKDIEHGGSLYIRYVGTAPSYDASTKPIRVRVSGGVDIPYLNLDGIHEEAEMKAVIGSYVDELVNYVAFLDETYKDGTYAPALQALNVTEIASDQMLFSISATEALKGIKNGSEDRAAWIENLYQNELAVEQLMDLTFAQKGFSDDAADKVDQKPHTRINIRYMDVQTAFMYAGGGHVGIPFGSGSGMMKGKPYNCPSDTSQSCTGGALYGWGISHEIGHVLDQAGGARAETSNNVVALYSSTIDETYDSRIGKYSDDYTEIYKKVTSGATGYSSSVFTQLGMYWQLHLAYDDVYIRPDDTSVFTARMYQAYRHNNVSGVDYDNLLIRMASVAADKDLSDYFAHWGLMANADTKAWLQEQGFVPETKPIYYLNETARRKRIEGTAAMASDTQLSVSLRHDAENGNDSKRAVLTMEVNKDEDKILGYEIYRNGEVIAFTNDKCYTDTIMTSNNRVYTYEVVAYDYNLNPTNKVTLDPVKISHDGSLDKSNWTISSNVPADNDVEGADIPAVATLKNAFDNDYSTVYEGNVAKGNVELLVDMNTSQPVVGFKYTLAPDAQNPWKNYEVQISSDKMNWQTVASGTLNTSDVNQTVFFSSDGDYASDKLETFDAQYVKFVVKQTSVSIAELDIIAPPGDNVELIENGIGILKEDFTYAEGKTIPKGSLIFTGEYRGNPAFNAVLLIDENDAVLGGEGEVGIAKSILMATIPEHSPLNEIAKGTWIYWIEPDQLDVSKLPTTIYAELYRVDDALDNSGQRLVSDTLPVRLPENLPEITLKNTDGE